MRIQILPSLLAAPIGRLEEGVRRAETAGADGLHIDIMDGHFVPNLSLGPAVVEMAKRTTRLPLNVHLMMTNPHEYVTRFAEAGATTLLIHIEAECDVLETIELIRANGMRPGITLNPETPSNMIYPVLGHVDEVLVMSVHPGYGGQKFIPESLAKIRAIRDTAKNMGKPAIDIMVDGGVTTENTSSIVAQGANMLTAGTTLYKVPDMKAELARMRDIATRSFVQ